ncbi:methyltransferase domain-containing protein [Paenibacillus sp. FSL H8-0537]|uniref:methyltransferase domain-containing protein n=1 Tax=Paenibacillus sp. FSL H8-0537 TaxID=2921399 RepID=UPI003100DFCB
MKYDFNIDMSSDNSLSLILRNIRPNSIVLEFGPARGYMTAYMQQELKCKVYGVEIDPEAAVVAQSFTEQMIICDIETMIWKDKLPPNIMFDHIIFADVLEHLRDPEQVLREAAAYLKADGTILSSIPNISHSAVIMELLSGEFKYRSLGLLDHTHIRFFTRSSVERLIEGAGLVAKEWNRTLLHPEHTELKKQYADLPIEISRYLEHRKDSHVYQFITISGKPGEQGATAFHLESDYIYTDFIQLFFETDEGFSERASQKKAILTSNDEYLSYSFDKIDIARGKKLRLDPTNFKALIQISTITLKNQHAETVNEFRGENLFELIHLEHNIVSVGQPEQCLYYVTDNDPQIHLHFNHLLLENVHQFHIEMRVIRESAHVITILKEIYGQQIINLQQLSRSRELQLEQAEVRLEEEQQIITNIEAQKAAIELQNLALEQNLSVQKKALEHQNSLLEAAIKREHEVQSQLEKLVTSKTWRLTKPLRVISRWFFKD